MDPEVLALVLTLGGGALIGAIGYVVRTWQGWLVAKQERHADLVASLHALAALLRTSKSLFQAQADRRDRLLDMLKRDHAGEVPLGLGYEATFTRMHGHFTEAEAELHGIVRTMTENGLRPVNKSVTDWLERDTIFKTAIAPLNDPQKLAHWLNQLELHLTLWHAKYEYWMPDTRHALVYLADEEDHGVPFPYGIEGVVEEVLIELGQPTVSTIPVPQE